MEDYRYNYSFYHNTNNSKWKTNSMALAGIIILII